MSQQMWFGTRGHEQWIKAPMTGADFSRKKYTTTLAYLNGGAAVQASRTSHAEYQMTWNVASRREMRPIQDFQSHAYDNDPLAKRMVKENLVYFIDPMEQDLNLAPIFWGNPILSATDAPSLIQGARPVPVATPSNTLHYPSFSAQYTVPSNPTFRSFYMPCPPGFTLWVGAHGSASGASVQVTPAGGAAVQLPLLAVTSQTLVGSAFTSGIDISLSGFAGTTITLSALIIQCLPTGSVPQPGSYISGRGHSGCAFGDEPKVTAYSSVNRRAEVGMTASLIEVGAWLPLS